MPQMVSLYLTTVICECIGQYEPHICERKRTAGAKARKFLKVFHWPFDRKFLDYPFDRLVGLGPLQLYAQWVSWQRNNPK